MSAPFLATYQDLVDYLSVSTGSGATTPEQSDVRMAAFRAYQMIGSEHPWAYYKRGLRIILQAPFSTGTVAYDHTGNVDGERLVTFSDAPPSWTRYGTILLGTIPCRISSMVSSTKFTLDPTMNPGEDVASGSFTLYQNSYDLPGDFRGAWEPTDGDNRILRYVSPREWQQFERVWPTQSAPWFWTIMPSSDSYGVWTLRIHGYSSELKTLDLLYQGRPRPLRFSGYETNSRVGTVSGTAGSATITGTNTVITSAMLGSLIRFSSDTSNYPTGMGGLNQWSEQKVITARASATSFTVDSALELSYTNTMYTVSDPLDVDEDLYELLVSACMYQLAVIRRSENVGKMFSLYKDAVKRALESNSKLRESQSVTAPIYTAHYGIPFDWRNEVVLS